jgi:hypothetical protein
VEYRSTLAPLGLPLVHVAIGRGEGGVYRRGVARGWIAVGDVAFGVLVALGGVSVGGVALGGLGVGAVALGGLALGAFAVGGLAIGLFAVGGAAFALVGALGGLAIARDTAFGGLAIAEHANDDAARQMAATGFFGAADDMIGYARFLTALPVLVVLLIWLRARRGHATP